MRDAAPGFFHGERWAEFENFQMLGFDERFQGGEIYHARTGAAMVFPGKGHIVNMKSQQPVRHRFQMKSVINESEVFFDLGMACIMPVANGRLRKFAKEK